jgi:putative DNA primase/helicase
MMMTAYSGFGYLTARHTAKNPRSRFILELSRPVDGAEGIRLGQTLQRQIEARLGSHAVKLDKSVYQGEQPLYGPLVGAGVMRYHGDPIDVDAVLALAPAEPPRERPTTPDPYRALIIQHDLLLRELGPGKDAITCPFAKDHSEVTSDSSTVYFQPLHGGYRWGHIDCKHEHCAKRKDEDYIWKLGGEPRDVWRGQGRLGAGTSGTPYDDLPPLESYDGDAAQEDARQRTPGAKVSAGDEASSGNGAAWVNCESRVVVVRGDALRVEPIRWLWDGWLARGKLHVLAGAPGAGKSTIALTLAAVVSAGVRWPDGTECTPGHVLVWSDEDDPADTLLPRLLAAGGDPKRFHIVSATVDRDGARQFDPATDIPALLTAAREISECALVIVDPVVTVVLGDSHKNTEVRRALQPLVGFASELDAAVFGVSHFTKGTAGRDPVERVTGSVAFGALPRVVMAAARVKGNAERRNFCRAKSNIGPDTGGWEYRLELAEVPGASGVTAVWARWGESLEGSARDLLAEAETIEQLHGESTARAEAEGWLKGSDSMDGKRLKGLARDSGIKERTLYRASADIGVVTLPGGFGKPRRWHLCPTPGKGCRVCQAPEDKSKPPIHEDLGTHEDSTPLKPSCGAGSTHVCQPSEENTCVGAYGSNPVGMRVSGGSDAHVCQDRQCDGESACPEGDPGEVEVEV